MVFSKKNPPLNFYVYAYLREDDSPYYIGKGKGKRAFIKNKKEKFKPPSDVSRIIILESSLTESDAFSLEKQYIKKYGRKDNGTGILRNQTDGGEGQAGRIQTKESNMLRSIAQKGIPQPRNSRPGEKHPLYGVPVHEETKKKISKSHLKFWEEMSAEEREIRKSSRLRGENSPNYGREPWNKGTPLTDLYSVEERKKKYGQQGEKNPMYGIPVPKNKCPHCDKVVDIRNYARSHGDKCRLKISS
jgi:hypothetical protein